MAVYQTKGTLTGTIEPENVSDAQHYLTHIGDQPANMQQFCDESLEGLIAFLEWRLDGNGHDYTVLAVTTRELTEAELKELSSDVAGQNSDGLGEGFEQQDFAWDDDPDEADCGECNGQGSTWVEVDDGGKALQDCGECDGAGYFERESGHMISFDWKKNELPWTRIA